MNVNIIQHQFSNGEEELVVIDLHGDTLYEVKTDLPYLISEHLQSGFLNFQIIHGFNSGQILKNYVKNTLINQLKRELKSISDIRTTNETMGIPSLLLISKFSID